MPLRRLACCEDDLHEDAILNARWDDFGATEYREGLRIVLESYDHQVQLTEQGWQTVYDSILRILIARLYTQRGWTQHPETLGTSIERPLIITGMPRTGSTALHKLLSIDPQFQGVEYWLAQTPMPRPPRETWEAHPRYKACVATIDALYNRSPDFIKIHKFLASEVEECGSILVQDFAHDSWAVFLPTYASWLRTQNAERSYRRYADVLRLIGAQESHKRRLLKYPFHSANIDILLKLFPDACIIQTHRDPLEVIPSFCSLVHSFWKDLEGNVAWPERIGSQQCDYWCNAMDRMRTVQEAYPAQFFNVDYRRFVKSPLETVTSIYDYFSFDLSPEIEQRMHAWVAAHETSRQNVHIYSNDSWGVTPTHIRNVFADYRAQHQFR